MSQVVVDSLPVTVIIDLLEHCVSVCNEGVTTSAAVLSGKAVRGKNINIGFSSLSSDELFQILHDNPFWALYHFWRSWSEFMVRNDRQKWKLHLPNKSCPIKFRLCRFVCICHMDIIMLSVIITLLKGVNWCIPCLKCWCFMRCCLTKIFETLLQWSLWSSFAHTHFGDTEQVGDYRKVWKVLYVLLLEWIYKLA